MKNKFVCTFAGGGGGSNLTGFTMAEILLSLTIIGVVAAITLPSLTGNINERTWNTQRKALYARFSQAIALMPSLNGYGTVNDTTDTAAETFVTAGLSKVLKINNICDSEHLSDCGVPSTVTNISGRKMFSSFPKTLVSYNPMFNFSGSAAGYTYSYSQVDTKAAAFETANGESIVVFYNPYCTANGLENLTRDYIQPKMCANFIYDLNGSKGPNTVGKDVGFITALYSSDSVVVAPLPVINRSVATTWNEAGKTCRENDSESRLPNMDELAAVFYNRDLMGITSGDFWSSSLLSSEKAYLQDTGGGIRYSAPKTARHSLWCIKR
ncbi:MAG: hypothetical protein NC390_00155 [Fusobacterium sp.]|nr:hypothetical protein [Fusobacterium sp.]